MTNVGTIRSSLIVLCVQMAASVHCVTTCAQAKVDNQTRELERRAQQLFDQAQALYAQREFQAAIEAFLESERLAPTANVAFNIAQTCELAGRNEDAFNAYQRYLAYRSDPSAAVVVARRLDALLERVAVLELRVGLAEAELTIDGAPLAGPMQATRLIALLPGEHVLRAEAQGHVPFTTRIETVRGTRVHVRVDLEVQSMQLSPGRTAELALPPSNHDVMGAPPARTARDGSEGLGDLRWVGYGAAVALVGTGIGLGIAAIDRKAEVEDDPERRGRDDVTRLNLAADLTAGTGLFLAVVTFVLDVASIGPVFADPQPHPSRSPAASVSIKERIDQ